MLQRRIIHSNYVTAAVCLQQSSADPFILLDTLAHTQMTISDAQKFAMSLDRSDVDGVLEFTASLIGENAWEKLDHLRSQECFGASYLKQKDVSELFSDKRLLYYVRTRCQRLSLEIPVGVRLATFKSNLDVQMKFYFNGEVTNEDFIPILRAMVQGDGILQNQALKHIRSKCGSLADYVAERCSGAMPEGPMTTGPEIPRCKAPTILTCTSLWRNSCVR